MKSRGSNDFKTKDKVAWKYKIIQTKNVVLNKVKYVINSRWIKNITMVDLLIDHIINANKINTISGYWKTKNAQSHWEHTTHIMIILDNYIIYS